MSDDLGACRECGRRYTRDLSFYDDESLCPGCGDRQADEADRENT
jgi:hypothetical protein